MSSSEDWDPKNASDEDRQSSQEPVNGGPQDDHGLEKELLLHEEQAGGGLKLHPGAAGGLEPDSSGDDLDLLPGTRDTEYETNSDYDENRELHFSTTTPSGKVSKDRLSRYKKQEHIIFERQIAASLDVVRSKDLSIHLYNAFKLKQAVRGKVPDEHGFVESKEPSKRWVAWPMTPDRVPREHETKKWEDPGWRVGPYVERQKRPGDELRDLLTGMVLKAAKERLEERQSDESSGSDQGDDALRPVILADDEVATSLLKPSIQYAMDKLGGALLALRHSRFSYATTFRAPRKKRSTLQVRTQSSQETTDVHRRSRLSTNADERAAETALSDVEDGVPDGPGPAKRQKMQSSAVRPEIHESDHSHRGLLGLRNWDDVLGLAAMSGIEPRVIQRAHTRCENLFGK